MNSDKQDYQHSKSFSFGRYRDFIHHQLPGSNFCSPTCEYLSLWYVVVIVTMISFR